MLYNNTMRSTGLAIILSLILPVCVTAQDEDLHRYYPPGSSLPADLEAAGEITRALGEGSSLVLIPAVSQAPDLEADFGNRSVTIGSESLFLIPLAEDLAGIPGDGLLLFILNRLGDIESLEGIAYYSASRGRYRTLFTRSFPVGSPGSAAPVPNPVFTALPVNRTIHTFQDDTTFGESTSRMTFRSSGDAVSLGITNITPLSLGPVRILGPEGMNILLLAVPLRSGLLLYTLGTAEAEHVSLFSGTVERSLYNRVRALKEWLASSLAAP